MIYAAYGSNLNHNQMAQRCPGARFIGKAIIRDYRLVFRRFCDIEAAKGFVVPVGLWKLTPACLDALDRYEGFPSQYGRTWVEAVLPNKKKERAMVYFMNYVGYEAPSERYVNGVAEGYEHCGIPNHRLIEALEHCAAMLAADNWPPEVCTQDEENFARSVSTQACSTGA
jgi:hypothetical protein